ncbi:MAG: long-chain-fatty-acid--CoA ligase [Thermodesulfobacteriota bacterium]|nr:long-chain-fatty-acid--CoA ligase [Thermodesulfobacteriota bacterium]
MTILDILEKDMQNNPQKIRVKFEDKSFTSHEFNLRINRLANALKALGVKKGDRVGVLLKNCNQYLEIPFATAKIGAITVTANFRLKGRELTHIFKDSGAKILVTGFEFEATIKEILPVLKEVNHVIGVGNEHGFSLDYEEILRRSPEKSPIYNLTEDDVVFIMYTSGTTGLSKGAMLTSRNLISSVINEISVIDTPTSSIALQVMPLYHVVWVDTLHYILRANTTVIANFDPENILKIIEKKRVTHTMMVPAMINALINYPDREKYDLKSIKLISYVGAPMPTSLLKQGIDIFGNIFLNQYGVTETCACLSYLSPGEHVICGSKKETKKLFSIGREQICCRIRILDDNGKIVPPGQVGEIAAKGPQIMKGYWNNIKETAKSIKNGWFHTGDLGYKDDGGYIYLVDRKVDMIISGGENIYSREIEDVLHSHHQIKDAAVIGIPDEKWGEQIKAYIVVKEGKELIKDEIITFCGKNLAKFKIPKVIEFIDELPKDPNGKVLKRILKQKRE